MKTEVGNCLLLASRVGMQLVHQSRLRLNFPPHLDINHGIHKKYFIKVAILLTNLVSNAVSYLRLFSKALRSKIGFQLQFAYSAIYKWWQLLKVLMHQLGRQVGRYTLITTKVLTDLQPTQYVRMRNSASARKSTLQNTKSFVQIQTVYLPRWQSEAITPLPKWPQKARWKQSISKPTKTAQTIQPRPANPVQLTLVNSVIE